ncbi:MAG TPA: hypothetical protein VMR45_05715 [Patescibacteria group bacterium]|nr:hypothetical protein [Patescibacteria group bacterium]
MAKKTQTATSSTTSLIAVIAAALVLVWAGSFCYWWARRSACPSLSGWGTGIKANNSHSGTQLTGVTAVSWNCYDRVVINLGETAVHYNVRYVNDVTTQGKGDSLSLSGGAKLAIDIDAASYSTDSVPWQTVYPATVGQTLPGVNLNGYASLKDAKWGGSFEGQSTIGLGIKSKLSFRVVTDGNQMYIDIAHKQ